LVIEIKKDKYCFNIFQGLNIRASLFGGVDFGLRFLIYGAVSKEDNTGLRRKNKY
jgi:hypothetical protein